MLERPDRKRLRAPCLFVFIFCAAALPAADTPPVLTRVRMIHELDAVQAERRYPVRLRAVVTYTDPSGDILFVQDESGGVYVDITAPYHCEVAFGQEVEV